MGLVELFPFPHTTCPWIDRIEVELQSMTASMWQLNYIVTGQIRHLRIPSQQGSMMQDNLWQHLCFEAFLHTEGLQYYEYNFSPSTQWAGYAFSDYRQAQDWQNPPAPIIQVEQSARILQVAVQVSIPNEIVRLGLSAVIEDNAGNKTYWALQHPHSQPDFHHKDGHSYEIRA